MKEVYKVVPNGEDINVTIWESCDFLDTSLKLGGT